MTLTKGCSKERRTQTPAHTLTLQPGSKRRLLHKKALYQLLEGELCLLPRLLRPGVGLTPGKQRAQGLAGATPTASGRGNRRSAAADPARAGPQAAAAALASGRAPWTSGRPWQQALKRRAGRRHGPAPQAALVSHPRQGPGRACSASPLRPGAPPRRPWPRCPETGRGAARPGPAQRPSPAWRRRPVATGGRRFRVSRKPRGAEVRGRGAGPGRTWRRPRGRTRRWERARGAGVRAEPGQGRG